MADLKGKMSTSIFPAALAEAKGAKISLSLFLVLALMGGTYYLGLDAGRGTARPELEIMMSIHDRRLENIATSLESIDGRLQMQGSSLTTIDSRMHNLNTEIQVLKRLPSK